MTSRATRPSRLIVPPEIFRFVTKLRRSLSDAFGMIEHLQQFRLPSKQPLKPLVKRLIPRTQAGDTVEPSSEGGPACGEGFCL
ncbi:hypothetical protein [Agrobacterium tumefaciens]|uniref:Uncharacterized protein n=1 Tax=Agrobacterium tumefaciens TaxID=358 RepID=A0AAP9IMS0_AGRTU|nr:hypothetical protein [Agrobacterium tumefaciens]QHW12011.1 hypothetical protein CG010_28075 [Agrobacterium tumefaciens]UXS35195.1 hypothetical protein FY152_23725 [Agrobacterium tumefaciens]UXS55899.1 hypothetical protein FY148_24545 [Agrobacterium tumefaciens]UXS81445.1 hypothetical protein FY145_24680 [Agrobacterium tumefaciens]UXT15969.1 hypothetical protein FY141_24685 [Agrobacterium tumefaciens]